MEKLTCTVAEWAKIAGISIPRAYDMSHIEGFPVVCIGRKRVILLEPAKQWLINSVGKILCGK